MSLQMWAKGLEVPRDVVARHLVLRRQAPRNEDSDVQTNILLAGEDS